MKNIYVARISSSIIFKSLKADWEALNKEFRVSSIFLSWPWLYTWWENYGNPDNLWLIEARREGKLVGIAPLMITEKIKHGIKFRVLKSLGTPDIDVSAFIITDNSLEILEEFCEFIYEQRRHWDLIELNEFLLEDEQTKFIIGFFNKKHNKSLTQHSPHYYLPISGKWEDYFENLPRNLRKDVNRRLRRANELGELRVEHISGNSINTEHLKTIFKINENGNFPDLYNSKKDQAFHINLVEILRPNNSIEISILWVNEEPVAFQYGFLYNNRYEDWRGGLNLEYHLFSAGKLLLYFSLKKRFDDNVKEVDFLRGTHGYKQEWGPETRIYAQIRIVPIKRPITYLIFVVFSQINNWLQIKKINKQSSYKKNQE